MLRRDPDVSIASAALSTLCVFDAFATPRAPPMQIITRVGCAGETTGDARGLTASGLMHGISESRKEIAASKEAQEERRTTRIDKKSNKRAKIGKAKKDAMNADAESQSDTKRADQGEASAYSESKINITPVENNNQTATEDVCCFVTQSLPSDAIDTAEEIMVEDGTCELHTVRQNIISDQRRNGMNESNEDGRAEEKEQAVEEEDSDDSMDDFPDIVDEDPDDEDKL